MCALYAVLALCRYPAQQTLIELPRKMTDLVQRQKALNQVYCQQGTVLAPGRRDRGTNTGMSVTTELAQSAAGPSAVP